MAQKYSLEWHETCLRSMAASLEEMHRQFATLTADIERLQTDMDKRRARIEAARKNGITELTA